MSRSTDSHLLDPGFVEDLRRERVRADAISIVGSILLGTALSILIIPFIIHCMERGFTIPSGLIGRVSVIAAILAALLAWANSGGRMSQRRVERWNLRFFKTLATTGAPPRDILIAAVNESGNPKLATYLDIRGLVEDPDPREFLSEIQVSDDSSAHRPFRNWIKRHPEASPELAIRHLHAQLMNCSHFYRRTPLLTGTAGPDDLASHRAAESLVESWVLLEMLDFDIEPERRRYRHPAVVLHSLVGDAEEFPLLDAVEVTLPSVSLTDLRRARDAERIVRSRMHLTSAREDRAVRQARAALGFPEEWPADLPVKVEHGGASEIPVSMSAPQVLLFVRATLFLLGDLPWNLSPREGIARLPSARGGEATIRWQLTAVTFRLWREADRPPGDVAFESVIPVGAARAHQEAKAQLVKELRTFSWTDLPFLAFLISGILIIPGCLLSLIALREAPLEYQRLTTLIFLAWLVGSLLISGPAIVVSWRRREKAGYSFLGPVFLGIMSSGILSATLTIGVNWIGSLFQSPTQITATAWREPGEPRVAYIKLDGNGQTTWRIPDFQPRGLRHLPIAPLEERLLLNCRRGMLGIHHVESAWPLTEQPPDRKPIGDSAPRPLAEDEE